MSGSHRVRNSRRRLPTAAVAVLVALGVLAATGGVIATAGWLQTGEGPRRTGESSGPGGGTARPSVTPSVEDPTVIYAREGSGDAVLTISEPRMTPGTPLLFSAKHEGTGVLSVTALDAAGETQEVLVAHEGEYDGESVIYADGGAVGKTLQIQAEGEWSISVREVAAASEITGEAIGSGDAVLVYRGVKTEASFTHEGPSEFAVFHDSGGLPDILFGGAGKFSGKAALGPGRTVVEIDAVGEWRLAVGGAQ